MRGRAQGPALVLLLTATLLLNQHLTLLLTPLPTLLPTLLLFQQHQPTFSPQQLVRPSYRQRVPPFPQLLAPPSPQLLAPPSLPARQLAPQ
ncbi:hypothetical protein B484DRAFT_245027 [Ochromonadaceae sp. CCMP2298]|nr:hypothetical protein B484DRAFT_245027 [Ochromonadaceae sp. CCMP2298]